MTMEVLIQGLEFTNQLHLLLLRKTNLFEDSALDLTSKIHQSFTKVLSLLNNSRVNNSVGSGGTSWDEVFISNEILNSSPVTTGTISSNADQFSSENMNYKALSSRPVTTQFSSENRNYKAFRGSSMDDELNVGYKRRSVYIYCYPFIIIIPLSISISFLLNYKSC